MRQFNGNNKKIDRTTPLIIILLLLVVGIGNAVTYTCDSCSDCNEKIQSAIAGDIVYLTANITNQSEICIEFNQINQITFDCQGNRIEGNNEPIRDIIFSDFGIYIDDSFNNSIKNCRVSSLDYGIFIMDSKNNILMNNTVDNNIMGISLDWSYNNTLTLNRINRSPFLGQIGLSAVGENDIGISNTINGLPVQYYDGKYNACPNNEVLDFNKSNQNISHLQLIGCNNVTINNLNISGLDGIYLVNTNNSRIERCVSNENPYGLVFSQSYSNVLINNTVYFNAYGILITMSNTNVVIQNALKNNNYGIRTDGSNNNTFYHNNLINNSQNTFDDSSNFWDNGQEGNYYSDYFGGVYV